MTEEAQAPKKKNTTGPIILAVIITALIVGGGMYAWNYFGVNITTTKSSSNQNTNASTTNAVTNNASNENVNTDANTNSNVNTSTTNTNAAAENIQLFFVALGDDGKTGTEIGCDDSIVAVETAVTNATAPLTSALEQLLESKEQYYGKSGLYNSLYRSNLKVDSVVIENNNATVNLSGTFKIGGACDTPRFEAQLRRTAEQFSTIQTVDIFINGITLEEALGAN